MKVWFVVVVVVVDGVEVDGEVDAPSAILIASPLMLPSPSCLALRLASLMTRRIVQFVVGF